MKNPEKIIFLPGATGRADFWHPMSDQLTHPAQRRLLGWPGFGGEPARSDVQGFDGLVDLVLAEIDRPCALVAQSMGGAVALRAALARPALVTHLVLCVTSGGVDMSGVGAQDWRPDFFAANPSLPRWFESYAEDLAPRLGAVTAPALLLWGDDDPISPVAVGQRLQGLLPNARLHVYPGGGHDLAHRHAQALAPLVDAHLRG
ncbi:alpha/beta fold hydrolase [Azohydromonas lata]|uniref:alpha/beta fold hydrolase n=1 Tax=Azohydromonas lata TaxID=45677 RepID=UPI0008338FBA|nr:alpha/beta fold hydrolase [Azohydromonas lata]